MKKLLPILLSLFLMFGICINQAQADANRDLDNNVSLDIAFGGTNATTAAGALTNLGAQAADTDLNTLSSPTAWRLFYSNGSGVITELSLGTSGQYLKSQGASSIPTWDDPSTSSWVEDDPFGGGWNNDTTHAPSQNSIYDQIIKYDTDLDGDIDTLDGTLGGAPTGATYITQTSDATLSNEQPLQGMSTGIMRVNGSTGVISSLTTSADIAANISDETGTGGGTPLLVFNYQPTLTSPTFSGTATGSISGNAGTATALAANPTNCSSGQFPLGVDASGAVESCTDAATQTELDAWTGSSNITTLGTIGTGIWNGTEITDTYISNTLTASIFIGSGSTTNAVDLATAEVAGDLPVGNLDSGTNASSSTFWRGDGTWAAPAGSGTVTGVGDCASGDCLDGTSDGGTYVQFYETDGATKVQVGDNSAAVTLTLPTATGTLLTSVSALNGANITADTISDLAINWGLTGNQVSASDMPNEGIGDLTINSGSWTINDDTIDKANFADEVWGDLTVSSNVVSVTEADLASIKAGITGIVNGLGNGNGFEAADLSDFPNTGTWTPTGTIDLSGATLTLDHSYYYQASTIEGLIDTYLDGSADAIQTFSLYDGDSNKATFAMPDLSGDVTITFPSSTGTLWNFPTNLSGLNTDLSSNIPDTTDDNTWTGFQTFKTFTGSLATDTISSIHAMDLFWTDPDNYDPASTGLTGVGNDYLAMYTSGSSYVALLKSDGSRIHGAFQLPYSDSGDATLSEAYIQQKSDEDGIAYAFAGDSEIPGEVFQSLIQHVSVAFDPTGVYDQESNYHVLPLFVVGDDFPHGITITEWKTNYVGGDPTTELVAELECDSSPDYNPAVENTDYVVMDDIGTTAGTASADTGFESASCANGRYVYIRITSDPTDSNVLVAFDLWFYAEED